MDLVKQTDMMQETEVTKLGGPVAVLREVHVWLQEPQENLEPPRCIHSWKLPWVPAAKPKCVGICKLCGLEAVFGDGPRRYVGLGCGHESKSVISIKVDGSWRHFCEACWMKGLGKEGLSDTT